MSSDGSWQIEHLDLKNFRCFEHVEMDFARGLTVLVGANGSGKSAILDGLAIMLSTIVRELGGEGRGFLETDARSVPQDLDSVTGVARMNPMYPISGCIHAIVAGKPLSWSRERATANGRTTWATSTARKRAAEIAGQARRAKGAEPVLPVIAAYGVERLLGIRRAMGSIAKTRFGAYAAALDPQSDLNRLSGFLEDLATSITNAQAFGDDPPLAAIAQFDAIERACSVILEPTGWAKPRWNPLVKAITLAHPTRGTLPLSYLSTGIKITAGLVIDLASRIARANPQLGSSELLRRASGIVLIDEIDLHLHPRWQQEIVPALRRTFPSVQFIVTTHSPQVLSTVDALHIRVLDGQDVRLVDHAAGLRSDVVLRTILDTNPEPDVEKRRQVRRYMAMVDSGRGSSEEARELRQELENEVGGIEKIPELAEADASMAFDDLLEG